MQIEWILYDEDEIDPNDPLGTFVISGPGGEIRQEATYLDSWFEALVDGLASLQGGDEETIEMLEEPDPLEFRMAGGKVEVGHDIVKIEGGTLEEFEMVLHGQLEQFLNTMQQHEGWPSNPTLVYLADTLKS